MITRNLIGWGKHFSTQSRHQSFLIPGIMLSLALMSLVTLYSVAPGLVLAQSVFFSIGAVVFLVASRVSWSFVLQYRWLWYAGLVVMLAITLALGTVTRGSTRWIDVFGLFSIQSSQLAVPLVALVVAQFLAPITSTLSLKHLLNLGGIIFLPAFLIAIEPDLGTTIVYLVSVGSIVLLRLTGTQIVTVAAGTILAAVFAWFVVLQPYQKARVTSFLSSEGDASTSHYNAYQSLLAVGSGQIWGKGIGQGSQSQLRFLPERQTDFVFASFAEEWGYVGATILITLYTVLFLYLMWAATQVSGNRRYYLTSFCTYLVFQTWVNIGMNMGLLPITGVTLPLLSYGGSSIIAIAFALGLAQNAATHTHTAHKLHIT